MPSLLAIVLNGALQFEYDREDSLNHMQIDYLNSMDKGMDRSGVIIGQQKVMTPSSEQKYEFVATSLYNAIKTENEGMIGSMTTYLAVRDTDLKQLKFSDETGDLSIELVHDAAFVPE